MGFEASLLGFADSWVAFSSAQNYQLKWRVKVAKRACQLGHTAGLVFTRNSPIS
jgi:hypothetical protein